MAESMIAASTRITFSTIANTAIALKRLRDGMKHAPENLSWLSDQLDCLQVVISNLETSIPPSLDGCNGAEHLVSSMKGCQTALHTLERLISDLSTDLFSGPWNQRTKARFKAVMKEEHVSRYRHRLEFTMRLLCLAQQNYAIKLAELLPGRLLAALDHQALQQTSKQALVGPLSDSIIQQPRLSNYSTKNACSINIVQWQRPKLHGYIYYTTNKAPKQHLQSTSRLQIQFPRWLLNNTLDFYIRRSFAGWKVNLYWSIFQDSKIVFKEAFWKGTRSQIFTAIADHGFHLCDRFRGGRTLTQCALSWERYDIALELLELGAPLNPDEDIRAALSFSGNQNEKRKANMQAFIRQLMSRNMLDEVLENPLQPPWSAFSYSSLNQLILDNIDMFNMLLRSLNISRTQFLWNNIPWLAISPKTLMDVFDSLTDDEKVRFYKSVSEASTESIQLFVYFFLGPWSHMTFLKYEATVVLDSISRIGAIFSSYVPLDLLGRSHLAGNGTPLCMGLLHTMQIHLLDERGTGESRRNRECSSALRRWLQALHSGGLDLAKYGRQEVAALERFNEKARVNSCASYDRFKIPYYTPRLVRIDVGPEPEDWKIHWDFCHLEYGREFWESVEFEPKMPGAWISA